MIATTLRLLATGAVLLGFYTAAAASPFSLPSYKIECKLPNCGIVSNAPKATLLLINPSPLPRVDPGDSQTVTVQWRASFGLRSTNALCVTASKTAAPASNDPCQNLPGASVLTSSNSSKTFEDTLSLSSGFYRAEAAFYVKTTSLIQLIGQPPNSSYSNRVGFQWPLNKTNLYAHNPAFDFSMGRVQIVHYISNNSALNAGASTTRFEVAFCDGLTMLPPNDGPDSGGLCSEAAEGFLQKFVNPVFERVGPLAAGTVRHETKTDVTSLYPNVTPPYWVSITAHVDDGHVLDESTEQDNVRLETYYMQ